MLQIDCKSWAPWTGIESAIKGQGNMETCRINSAQVKKWLNLNVKKKESKVDETYPNICIRQ